jgi:hypothetical protein
LGPSWVPFVVSLSNHERERLQVFPGLRLHVAKLLADDLAGVLTELAPAQTNA